ncbi:hypothetical protein [Streptomyces sp. TE33382]
MVDRQGVELKERLPHQRVEGDALSLGPSVLVRGLGGRGVVGEELQLGHFCELRIIKGFRCGRRRELHDLAVHQLGDRTGRLVGRADDVVGGVMVGSGCSRMRITMCPEAMRSAAFS